MQSTINTSLLLSKKRTLFIRLTCIFWLVAKIICYKIWLADRIFPLLPPFDFLTAPPIIHWLLFILSLLLILLLFVFPAANKLYIGVMIIEILSCSFDQNRWQPWEYQYLLTILIFYINSKKEVNSFSLLGLLFVSIYFYSGLGKMNYGFIKSVWVKQILTDAFHLSPTIANQPMLSKAGYLLGILEILFSVGLLFVRTRKPAAILLMMMHLLILLVFGPWGLNYDAIVWPWKSIPKKKNYLKIWTIILLK